jgi:flagella basal body P-ring formation protein FlgA
MNTPFKSQTLSFRKINLAMISALLVAFLVIFAGMAQAADVSITLKEKAVVEGSQIHMGDICLIDSLDPDLGHKIDRLVVAKAPQPGRSRKITIDYLRLRLKQMDLSPDAVVFSGPEQIQVTRNGFEVSEKEIAKIVDDFLQTNRIWGNAAVEVKDIQLSADRTLPKGHTTYQVEQPDHLRSLSTLPLSIVFDVDGKYQKTIRANVKVAALGSVVLTAKPIGRLKPISVEDLKVEVMDLVGLSRNVITDIDEIVGKRARRNIQAGEFLRPDLIEMPPLVKRGDLVTIVAESKGLKVTAIGEVKSAGRLGERVKVVNLDSNKRLSAWVVDNKTVKVEC